MLFHKNAHRAGGFTLYLSCPVGVFFIPDLLCFVTIQYIHSYRNLLYYFFQIGCSCNLPIHTKIL